MSLFFKKVIYCLFVFGIFNIKIIQCNQTALDVTALENFIEYLRIPSVHPNVNYDDCVNFLKKQAMSLELPFKVLELHPKKPIVIITWKGTEPDKPSILLNGHMDVVPVIPEEWKYPPFEGKIDENGDIYARGAQDMKSLTVQHLEAIRRLKSNGIRLKRTIHVTLVPDEEIGGEFGMKMFVKSQQFKDLNIGFALDEGSVHPEDKFYVTHGERTLFQVWIHCSGTPGHGSSFLPNTPGEKLRNVIDLLLAFRETEMKKLEDPEQKNNVTSINLTMLKGGVQVNVVPNDLSVAFDIRISPFINHGKFVEMFEGWLKKTGDGITYTTMSNELPTEITKLDSSNIYWLAFKKFFDENSIGLEPRIMPGATDARNLRALGIPALGLSLVNNGPSFAHANNEHLNKDVFLKGINIFMQILMNVANV